ncbi:phosphoglycerate mutase family protein [Tasmannia lanceolata]|uniref:phosphoglycerate mutase family protein n=1 Tax=Tasmannia lanceolata TaxID=3420 RepID=UPI004063E343
MHRERERGESMSMRGGSVIYHGLSPSLLSKTFFFSFPCRHSSICPKSTPLSVRSLAIEAVEAAEEAAPPKSASRRLILLRHAESLWENRSLRDHDRPLSKAGRTDATNVSLKLQQMGWMPDLILSSDATRTRETLEIMQEHVLGFLEAEVHFIASFYSIAAMDGQTAEHLQQAICQYATNEMLTVMCMGHNRGWEEAASMFSGASVELKTCNAALLEAAGKSWDEAFALAGFGGWKLHGIVKPSTVL